jgi:hypothetical protein
MVNDKVATKQDTISDLATIRSGAAAGATAVQPAALQEGLAGKQDTISDLSTIRSGAAAGATAVQPTELQEGLAEKQDTIEDLATIRSGAAAGSTAVQPATMNTALAGKQDTISTVNVTVDNNTGTPSGSASVSGSTLSLSFQNLKGATGERGPQGETGPRGERGLPGESGVTGDVSEFTVIQTIDPSATYGATDIAGAATVQATYQELTELSGELYINIDLLSRLEEANGNIANTGKWNVQSTYIGGYADVSDLHGETVKITANNNYASVYAFTKDKVTTNNTTMSSHYATGSTKTEIAIGATESVVVPDNAGYLYVYMFSNDTVRTPSSISVRLASSRIDLLEEECASYGTLKETVDNITDTLYTKNLIIANEWEQGAISSSTGDNTSSTTRLRMKEIHNSSEDLTLTFTSGKIYYIAYDSNGNFVSANGWITTSPYTIAAGSYYRLVYAVDDSTTMSTSMLSNLSIITTGLVDKVADVEESITDMLGRVIDTSNLARYSLAPYTDLKWRAGTRNQSYSFLDVSLFKGRKISVQWNGNKTRVIPVTGISGVGDKILFSGEPRAYILDTDRTSCDIYIEDSCNYLAFQSVSTTGEDLTPTFTLLADIVSTYEFEEEKNITPISLTDQYRTPFGRSEDTLSWNIPSQTQSSSYLVDVSKCKGGTIYITQENVEGSIYFLTEDNREVGALIPYADNDGLISTTIGVCVPYKIPTDANYVNIVEKTFNGTDQHPTEIYLSPLPSSSPSTSNTYSNIYLNVVKKAKQMTNLRWTAKSNIAGTYCTAGEKTGLLYSSCVETDRYVGHDVSMRTFMTCANNPYSLLYTENLATRTSDYGFTYVGNRGTIHAWMGTVCSRFTASCCGMDGEEWDTAYMAWLCEEGVFTKIYDQSGQGVEVGDWIWISGHVRIITDVKKSDGLVTSIAVSEAWQPLCRVVNYTPTTLNTYLSSNHGIIYRYNELYKNVTYEPSPFIAIDDEVLSGEYVYNNDICTYAGDYAAFYEGFPVWINYNLSEVGSWTQMQVYKNDVLVGTYNIDTSVHRFNLTEAYGSLGYGKWKARLTDGTNYSDYTYWEVIETNVAYTTPDANTPNVKKVTFSSSNGTPTRVVFCEQDGTPMAVRPLSIAERMDGYVVFNPVAYCKAQRGENLGSGTYLRVYFVGEYGRVSNAQILTDIGSN